ncbi:signal transduction histidine kinase [Archangium gephyra]|uniref:histidine kinase n=1 Tax=Archangium gephyra TaxID=48 RepID=A0AAC8TAW2_9BACT|nr:ATP-binding protein [Archangium gephyra]AKI99266.1 Putative SigmaB asociated two-component system sensor protein [Archangium gephyra]REG31171.1 signal transduction histidine kinase [Archangium gephyra]
MTASLPASLWHFLSREVALVCDAAGTLTWVDDRAVRLLETGPGQALRSLAAQGTEDKVDRLVTLSRDERVERWEVILCVGGQPRTFAFRGAPHEGGSALVGSLVTEDYAASLSQVSETLSELASLHRETERQQRELKRRADELARINRELEESNRGVRTLHAELDEKTESLVRAAEIKSRVVANVSHEFRTPLHSILGLARLLLNPANGSLSPEQQKQVQFIRSSGEALFELVNDLLDLSKMESGKATLRPVHFGAGDFLGALRGMMRPLVLADSPVELRFETPPADLALETDEAKVSQVVRNLVSNALKFTEKGHVTVTAERGPEDTVCFRVSDTGIGIAPEHHAHIFEEFTQVESPLQKQVKGTGLGLALSRRLAEFLGGSLTVQSAPGRGSTFTFTLPRVHPEVMEMVGMTERSQQLEPGRAPVLVLEDDRQTLFLYEKYLSRSGFQVLPVRTVEEARRTLQRVRPAAVVMDVMLEGETSWSFLSELKSNEATRDIPVLVVTLMDREQKARALGADEFWLKPLGEEQLLRKLAEMARSGPVQKLLIIDDDEVHRYLLRQLLRDTPYLLSEAGTGPEGLRLAREQTPDLIFLDFVLPDMTAFDVLDELKADPRTRDIPVILHTSRQLQEEERARLEKGTSTILAKHKLSREVAITRIRDALHKTGLGTDRGESRRG